MVTHSNRFITEETHAAAPMSCQLLGRLIYQVGEHVEGWHGFWQFHYLERDLICVGDETHDRMRVITSVADLSEISSDQLMECLEANFDRALDARYCVSDGTVWSVFVHPLRSLTPELFCSACKQVVEAANNFGTSYSSCDDSRF